MHPCTEVPPRHLATPTPEQIIDALYIPTKKITNFGWRNRRRCYEVLPGFETAPSGEDTFTLPPSRFECVLSSCTCMSRYAHIYQAPIAAHPASNSVPLRSVCCACGHILMRLTSHVVPVGGT
jgi:hypothetical protein